jgi:hypothetical protein
MKTELAVLALFLVGWLASATGTCAYNSTPPLGGVMYVSCETFSVSEPCYLYVSETGGPGVATYPENASVVVAGGSTGDRVQSDAAGHLAFGLPVPQSPYHVGVSYTATWFCANDAPDPLVFVPGIPGQPAQVTDWMEWLKNEGNLGFLGLIGCAGVVGILIIGVGLSLLSKARS